jgi:hypothetical protein
MPPAHFNVLRASDKQLREYGIPTRKQLGHRWYSVMRHFRRVAPPEPYLVEVPSFLVSGGASPRVCQLPSCTGNWVGHYVTGHTYKEVTVTWAEPSFTNGGCTNGEFVQWAGLGGTTSPVNLAQAGTTFNVPNFAAHEGFIETIIGGVGPMVEATQFVPSHGDSVYSSILWDSATTEYSYFMEDFTTGTVYSAHSRTDSSPDNSTAEVISERPNNPPTDLSKFQNDSFTGATSYWGTSSAGFVNNPNHYNLKMEGISGDTLATSSNLDSNSNFSNTWVACH